MVTQALLLIALLVQMPSMYTQEPAINTTDAVTIGPVRNLASNSVGVEVTATAGIVIDRDTQQVLWEQMPDHTQSVASVIKLVSALVFLEEGLDMNDTVVMLREDQRAEGGNRQLYLGEEIRIQDLLHSMLIASDNEAVMALVRYQGYSQEEFAAKVNTWLLEHNFSNTVVTDPTGLSAGTRSTAREVAQFAEMAFSHPIIKDIVYKSTYTFTTQNTGRVVQLENTNMLLGSGFGIQAGKTGFIDEAGYCFTTLTTTQDGHGLITVILGSDSITNRFQDTKAVLYWVQEAFTW